MVSSPLLINESPLQVLPTLAQHIGLNEAIILQQVHYWLNPKHNNNIFDGQHWVWNTYEQWRKQLPFWSQHTIRRAIANLEERGLLKSFVSRDFKKTKYYSIDYAALSDLENVTPLEPAETLDSCPSAQNGQIDLAKFTDRFAQNEQIDLANLGRSYIDTETTTENTPPLTPPNANGDEKEEEEKFKKMIFIWNQTVQKKLHPGQPVFLTPKRIKKLELLVEKVFQDKTTWEDYCVKIANSRFLMGENLHGFKVSLDWALNENNACKVLEGAIYDKSSKEPHVEESWEEIVEKIKTHLTKKPCVTEWIEICKVLVKSLGLKTFKSWFLNIDLLELGKDLVVIQVDSNFREYYITTHFYSDVERAVRTVYPAVERIEFQVAQQNEPKHFLKGKGAVTHED